MTLGHADIAVLAFYFAAILAFGLWFGRGERNTEDFFLGGRRQHWLIVGLSIVATEVSALTFIAVPAESFRSDWNYLQMYAGAFLGRILIVLLLLPAFYGGRVTTVYEYLGQRFGPGTRVTASLLFFASRIIGSGFRLLAAALAIAVVFDWPLVWVVLGAATVAVAYTTFGGIKAIIWTDALQAIVFLTGGIVVAAFLLAVTPGAATTNLSAAWEAGKLDTFTWDIHPNNDRSFWVLLIHATLINMAALGTDQDLTQRMLTCPDLRRGQRSLMFNAVIGFPIVCLFLLIGTLLWLYYARTGTPPLPEDVRQATDRIFPYFIVTGLPVGSGARGLLLAGIFAAAMSSLDSALGAMSSTAVTDFYRPIRNRFRTSRGTSGAKPPSAGFLKDEERHFLLISRIFTFLFGVVLAVVALAFASYDELLWEVFKWAGIIFGAMLGIFLLGVTTRNAGHDKLNVVAMLSSVALIAGIKVLQEQTETVYIAWPWWIVIGTGWTYLLAALGRRRIAPHPPRVA